MARLSRTQSALSVSVRIALETVLAERAASAGIEDADVTRDDVGAVAAEAVKDVGKG